MNSKSIIKQFKNLGLEVLIVQVACSGSPYSKVILDNILLTQAQVCGLVNMPCFVRLGISWAHSVPRIEIWIDRSKCV